MAEHAWGPRRRVVEQTGYRVGARSWSCALAGYLIAYGWDQLGGKAFQHLGFVADHDDEGAHPLFQGTVTSRAKSKLPTPCCARPIMTSPVPSR